MPKATIPSGTVILVDAPVPKERIEISQSTALKSLPKRPLSAKQQENLNKLIERNKVKWRSQRKEVIEAVPEAVPEDDILESKPRRNKKLEALKEIPTEIPDGKVLAVVKSKRAYKKKVKIENVVVYPKEDSKEESEESEEESEEEPEEEEKLPLEKPKLIRSKYAYSSDTSVTSDDSDDDRQYKYVKKTNKRLNDLQQINDKLRRLQMNRNLSVF
jgi:hypothetical protein